MRGWLLLCLFYLAPAWAEIDAQSFDNQVDQQRYQSLIEEMRCPKCQNQNLADSNSPIAHDLRREVHRMVADGRSDKEIVDFMVGRYGEFVLYRPRWDQNTRWLWLAPGLLLVVGGVVIWRLVRRRRGSATPAPLAEVDQARLQQLLRSEDAEP